MSLFKGILLTLTLISFTASGQSKIREKDSVEIKTLIEGFYSWYIEIVKNGRLQKDFNPYFVKNKDGMTTLDFSKYEEELKKFKFSEEFIKKKTQDYKSCVDNLASIPFDKFITYELEEYEKLKCEFSNFYEWTGGQEPKDKAELTILDFFDEKFAIGQIKFIYNSKFDGEAMAAFIKTGNSWNIYDIKLK